MEELSFIRQMVFHPKAVREFEIGLEAIKPIMTDATASREEKRSTLCMMVDQLSADTFKLQPIVKQIMTIINMKDDVCKEYADSETQTDGILSWLPRMKMHRKLLLNEVKAHRKEYKLKV